MDIFRIVVVLALTRAFLLVCLLFGESFVHYFGTFLFFISFLAIPLLGRLSVLWIYMWVCSCLKSIASTDAPSLISNKLHVG